MPRGTTCRGKAGHAPRLTRVSGGSRTTTPTRTRSERTRVCAVRANADAKGTKPATPLLDTINYAAHMKNLSATQLKQLAQEVRV